VTLAISLACGAGALGAAILGRLRGAPSAARLVKPAAAVAFAALLVSLTVHLGWGHTPGGPEALPAVEFLQAHRSFLLAAAIPMTALVTSMMPAHRTKD
jgi:hypothetical protein